MLLFWFYRHIKAALLPSSAPATLACCTKAVADLRKPTFGENFPLSVPLSKLCAKTLQVHVWCASNFQPEECLVSAILYIDNTFLIFSLPQQTGILMFFSFFFLFSFS